MDKSKLITELKLLSSGTIVHIINDGHYEAIDNALNTWLDAVEDFTKEQLSQCKDWMDALYIITGGVL